MDVYNILIATCAYVLVALYINPLNIIKTPVTHLLNILVFN